ncbi:TIGR00255 family protein [Eubacterium ruminantium]|uniref:TIGR00255 family protein n=1 Tax=Eubacterium ruminantium TaxID=42322 RepID=A0A1T4MN09_9FIRM|nr:MULTISPECIES: YicC/YloC family endoribonuclease [Eubacterium]MCR5367925.1 YicC family protein [Eubacterium sp.]SCW48992.1 TIGR00255 family protein [Eubacterium ruminantium]SDM59059.1 TIGR00255 family protein [Eubacterium ruminantium]SJZ68164.1 TIGR00255 family protein [Eubacterium ruminantium]
MIRSMTGFGRSEYVDEDKKIAIEIKSVNHRYSDINIKMPRKFNQFEAAMRTVLKDYIERGKVDVFVTYEDYAKSNLVVKYNKEIAAEYIGHLEQMKQDFDLNEDFKPTVIADFPEVFSLEEKSEIDNSLYETIEKTLREAGENFSKARAVEGENLKNDMLAKLDEMAAMVDKIEEMSPTLIAEYKEKLTTKVKELIEAGSIDESRIAAEVVIYSDKICVDEEIVRLKSHIEGVKNILLGGGAVGRKLDFIVQEMNRESNTILSKSDSLAVTDIGIELKTCIEKIREQIQNLE